ncbi:MAG: hypothetical protein AAGI53_04245 [Planctomycetota bacterium]
MTLTFARWLGTLCVALSGSAFGQFRVPDTLSPEQAARFERFETFQIKGVCGVRDLERLSEGGVNTVRGYTIPSPGEMTKTLDRVHELGMKMVVSEWMPHHGENKDRRGGTYRFDYDKRREIMVAKFIDKVEGIGDHPALLMWGLGNEVHLDEPYLRTVNEMSKAVHERFPHHVTSLTMINAKPEAIEAVKKYAPDLDVLGIQSYSVGAVRGAIRNTETHWRKPFYVSEFNGKGPWNFKKTEWGEAFDEPVDRKVSDVHSCYDAIDASELCLGSTIFVWGHFGVNRPTYFSMLLDEHPDGRTASGPEDMLVTPQAEAMIERFSGRPIGGNRAPVLTSLKYEAGTPALTVSAGERFGVTLDATDADGDRVTYAGWVLDSKPNRAKAVSGPFDSRESNAVQIEAPSKAGEYLVMIYALDGNGGASASTLPLRVR